MYELQHTSETGSGGREAALLTTADAQEVILHYSISSRVTAQWLPLPNRCKLGCEASRSEKDMISEENALTVLVDTYGTPWKWIEPEESKEQGGIRCSMEDLMVLAGSATSEEPSLWIDAWLIGAVLQ
eukprot:2170367-Amphidinium_carterae.1